MTDKTHIFPFADADVQSIEDAAAVTVTIKSTLTILQGSAFGQNVTLSLAAEPGLRKGSRVIVDVAQGATPRDVAFGSAGETIVAPALTGVANDRDLVALVWTGDKFIAETAWQKIVDAA